MAPRKKPIDDAIEELEIIDEDRFVRDDLQSIVLRPDGYYWLAPDGNQEFGPFASLELAQADMAAGDDEVHSLVGETLQEAENEIGIAEWIDPETGLPAEGQSPPHLDEE